MTTARLKILHARCRSSRRCSQLRKTTHVPTTGIGTRSACPRKDALPTAIPTHTITMEPISPVSGRKDAWNCSTRNCSSSSLSPVARFSGVFSDGGACVLRWYAARATRLHIALHRCDARKEQVSSPPERSTRMADG